MAKARPLSRLAVAHLAPRPVTLAGCPALESMRAGSRIGEVKGSRDPREPEAPGGGQIASLEPHWHKPEQAYPQPMRSRRANPTSMFGFGILAGMFVLMTGTVFGGWEIEGRLRTCVAAISVAGAVVGIIGHFIASRRTELIANETGGKKGT